MVSTGATSAHDVIELADARTPDSHRDTPRPKSCNVIIRISSTTTAHLPGWRMVAAACPRRSTSASLPDSAFADEALQATVPPT
jgi:hypothetical protein